MDEKTIEERVEELAMKEADLIESLIDKGAEHSTEIDNLGKLLNHHEKAVENNRAFADRSEQSANAERELRDRLETSENERNVKRREIELKEREAKLAEAAAEVDSKSKKIEAWLRFAEIAVKLGGTLGCTIYTCKTYKGFVRDGYQFESTGHYVSSDTMRWVSNLFRTIK